MKITKAKLKKIIQEELGQVDEEFKSSFSGKGSAEIGKWLEMMAHNFENKWYALNDYLIDAGLRSKDPEDEWTVLIAQTHDNLKKLAAELPAALDAGPGEQE